MKSIVYKIFLLPSIEFSQCTLALIKSIYKKRTTCLESDSMGNRLRCGTNQRTRWSDAYWSKVQLYRMRLSHHSRPNFIENEVQSLFSLINAFVSVLKLFWKWKSTLCKINRRFRMPLLILLLYAPHGFERFIKMYFLFHYLLTNNSMRLIGFSFDSLLVGNLSIWEGFVSLLSCLLIWSGFSYPYSFLLTFTPNTCIQYLVNKYRYVLEQIRKQLLPYYISS